MKKNVVFALILLVLLVAAVVFFSLRSKEKAGISVLPAETLPVAAKTDDVSAALPKKKIPASFDIVRVEQDGSMIAAGKGEINERLFLMDGSEVLAKITVNEDGEWVYIPPQNLAAGTHELWLQDSSRNPREESEVVVVTVPEQGGTADAMAVMLSADNEDITVLQAPAAEPVESLIDVQTVNYNKGALNVAGKVQESGKINVYINNGFAGSVYAGKAGKWVVKTSYNMEKGRKYTIRADMTDAKGQVKGRVEVPFEINSGIDADKMRRVRVVKGDCLWTIAKYLYGTGNAYVTIYQANKNQIKDPDLIYPNQVFVLPAKAGK